jgi:hypothetical protein
MKRRHPKALKMVSSAPWLGAGVSFVLGIAGWASETPHDEASALFGDTELSVHMPSGGTTTEQAGIPSELLGDAAPGPAVDERMAPASSGELRPSTAAPEYSGGQIARRSEEPSSRAVLQRHGEAAPRPRNAAAAKDADAQLERLIAASRSEAPSARFVLAAVENPVPTGGAKAGPPAPGDATPPQVKVRVGQHGDYDRVAFEWPEAIRYEVAQNAEQVTIAFSRAGKIDLSPLRKGFGRSLIEARAVGGDVTDRVVLRVAPNASIRTFSARDKRVAAVDVFAEAAPQPARSLAPAPKLDPIEALPKRDPIEAPKLDSIEALRNALEQRDEVIENLLVRVEQLERRLALSSGDLDTVVAGGGGAGALGAAPAAQAAAQPPTAAQEAAPEPGAAVAQEAAPAPGAPQGGEPAANAPAAPGEFAVSEEDIDRALERTLVQTGVLLLPFGQAEIEPYFSYTREEGDVPVLFADEGRVGVGNQEVRRNEFVTGQALRVGLPFDSQVELDLPYRYVDQSVVTPVGFGQREDENGTGYGVGDLRIGVAKTLLRENGGWWPDLVARINWDTNTGETTDNDVVLGGGFNELRGSLSAVKRQDPLAFVGGVSYEKTFENNDVAPGDEIGFSLGTVLAASPGTSLRMALNQTFTSGTEVNGEEIDGSDDVIGTASFGASVVLGRGVLLDVAADIGLTDDAPDYAARASLPIRFNLPVY